MCSGRQLSSHFTRWQTVFAGHGDLSSICQQFGESTVVQIRQPIGANDVDNICEQPAIGEARSQWHVQVSYRVAETSLSHIKRYQLENEVSPIADKAFT